MVRIRTLVAVALVTLIAMVTVVVPPTTLPPGELEEGDTRGKSPVGNSQSFPPSIVKDKLAFISSDTEGSSYDWKFAFVPTESHSSRSPNSQQWRMALISSTHTAKDWWRGTSGATQSPECSAYVRSADAIKVTTSAKSRNGDGGGGWQFDGGSLDGGKGVRHRATNDGTLTEDSESIMAVAEFARLVGPDYFEGTLSVIPQGGNHISGLGSLISLMFIFDRNTCSYWSTRDFQLPPPLDLSTKDQSGPSQSLGDSSFVYINHLYKNFEGLIETTEHAHFSYAPRRRLACAGYFAVGSNALTEATYEAAQEIWRPHQALGNTNMIRANPPKVLDEFAASYHTSALDARWLPTRPDPTNKRYTAQINIKGISGGSSTYPHPAGGYAASPYYKDYYLSYKGLKQTQATAAQTQADLRAKSPCKEACSTGYAALATMDLLGRLDYDTEYIYDEQPRDDQASAKLSQKVEVEDTLWQQADTKAASACRAPPSSYSPFYKKEKSDSNINEIINTGAHPSLECLLSLLRNKVIYFIGDSHMRIYFYGFLTRVGIAYPLNKVWRGDRTDRIESHNVTVTFIASYFLSLTKPSAVAMLKHAAGAPNDILIVANVGQHHSAHCWPLRKHSAVTREAMLNLLYGVPLGEGDNFVLQLPAHIARHHGLKPQNSDAPLPSRSRRKVFWLGVPAQPLNSHLYTPKPVGQSRKDCRNNLRHYLFNAEQARLWTAVNDVDSFYEKDSKRDPEDPPPILSTFIDAFGASKGMEHTSLDGAHYFSWVRAAWLDALVRAIRAEHEERLL